MRNKKVGLIGFGSIGQSILKAWHSDEVTSHQLVSVLVRGKQLEHARANAPPGVKVTDAAAEFPAGLDVVVEAAGHNAVLEHGETFLRCGIDFMVLSVGCLANDGFLHSLKLAAHEGSSRILLPIGATAGLDGLLALRRAGLYRVKYTSKKPPAAWKGTPAQSICDLDALTQPRTIFSGTAREAASMYPRNANITAAVALAGLGFDQTQVDLVADPNLQENVGHIEAEGKYSKLAVTVSGSSVPGNPKTSRLTGMSVLSALDNEGSLVSFL